MEKFKLLNLNIGTKKVKEICTNISFYEFEHYTHLWLNEKNISKAVDKIFDIYNKGYSVMDILDNYFIFIKITDSVEQNIKYKIIKIICEYISIFHNIHENEIELVLFTNKLIKC